MGKNHASQYANFGSLLVGYYKTLEISINRTYQIIKAILEVYLKRLISTITKKFPFLYFNNTLMM